MANQFYVKYSGDNSYSVMQQGRRNEFGEVWCEIPMVTQYEAEQCVKSLNEGKDAYAWMAEPAPKTYDSFYEDFAY